MLIQPLLKGKLLGWHKEDKTMTSKSNSFLSSLINKEREYITKLLEEKLLIEKDTEIAIKELKEKYDKLWLIEKESIDKQSYSVEKRESGIRENLLWENYYELINLSYILDRNTEKAIMLLIDFFLKGGKFSD